MLPDRLQGSYNYWIGRHFNRFEWSKRRMRQRMLECYDVTGITVSATPIKIPPSGADLAAAMIRGEWYGEPFAVTTKDARLHDEQVRVIRMTKDGRLILKTVGDNRKIKIEPRAITAITTVPNADATPTITEIVENGVKIKSRLYA